MIISVALSKLKIEINLYCMPINDVTIDQHSHTSSLPMTSLTITVYKPALRSRAIFLSPTLLASQLLHGNLYNPPVNLSVTVIYMNIFKYHFD